jgi:lipopolysaccharide transport system permease protein
MANSALPITIITSDEDSLREYLLKIWRYRALIAVFAKRDLKVKYAQTFLGLGWTIIQPLTALLIFSFFFGYVLQWKAEGLPYSLYVLSGLIGWNFFAYIVFQGMNSVQESAHVIKKIYFPKIVLPLSKVLVALVELAVTFLLFIPLLIWYEQSISWKVIFIPAVLLFNTLIALFLVLFTASLAYRIRDLFHVVPFLLYFGVWVTPIFFTKNILPQQIGFIWYFNPMASVIEAWRWCLFPDWEFNICFIPALLFIMPLFAFGVYLYSKAENNFSDFS